MFDKSTRLIQPQLLASVFVFLAILICGVAHAADSNPPERMTYQGFLVDGNGNALAPSAPKNYDVIFRIYDSQSGGNLKWSEQQTVTVDKGYFSILLGEGSQVGSESHAALSTIFTGADASDRFVGLTVKGIGAGNSDVDIMPRLRLLTSPYTFLARNSVNAANLANSASSQIVTVSGSNVGINKAVPTVALDVVGAGKLTGNLTANNVFIGDVGHGYSWAGLAHKDAIGALSYAMLQNASGLNTYINAKSGTGASIDFRFDNTPMVKIAPGGHTTINGGLGVGVATPQAVGLVQVGGPLAGFAFQDRINPAFGDWTWYSQNGSARLYTALNGRDCIFFENNGKIGIPGGNALEFGYGVAGKEANAGKIGYGTFTPDTLDIVGAGPSAGLRKVKIHASGGLTLDGAFTHTVLSTGPSGGWNVADRSNNSSHWAFYATGGRMGLWNNVQGVDHLSIKENGNVGIGTSDPQYKLSVVVPNAGGNLPIAVSMAGIRWHFGTDFNGHFAFATDTLSSYINRFNGNFVSQSDLSLKKNIEEVGGVLDRVLQLRSVTYHFNGQEDSQKKNLGFIAQEVEPLFPELVEENNGKKGLAYTQMIPVAIAAIQELHAQVHSKDEELQELKREVKELRALVEKLVEAKQ